MHPPQPTEEDPEFSAVWNEAIVVMEQKDKRKIIEAAIEKIESYIPETPQDSIKKKQKDRQHESSTEISCTDSKLKESIHQF
jgi:hypothetical protein